ncbi:MAG: Ligand-binding SRPBCC domain protein family [Pseudolabrys sp.]|jgi:uncharacterized protein YndB with AHSA1/START domain|nr:Ligand-binding SRPBCC domain protein family [Pseudolabrys sp.]
MNTAAELANERTVVIVRELAAPRALVWKAWTDPAHMARWFGPRMFTIPECRLDVRVGGALWIVMRGPDGNDYPMKGVFREVIENERLVFTNIAVDTQGRHLLEGETTVIFENHGAGTQLIVRAFAKGVAPHAPQMLAGMQEGWSQTLDKLGEALDA